MKFAPQLKLIKHNRLIKYLNGEHVSPINVEISPSGKCQANCDWCFFKNDKNLNMIDTDTLSESINQFKNMNIEAVTWTGGGEPTLHPDFNKFVQTLYSLNIKQGLFTNGLEPAYDPPYDPSMFEWIRVSYTSQGWGNLGKLRKCKSLGMCINYTGDDKVIMDSLEFAEEYGSDYLQVRPALNSKGEKVKYEIPKIKHPLLIYTDYKFENSNKDKCYGMCEGYHFVPYITEQGKVAACPYQSENDYYILGDLKHESFFEIMFNAARYKKVTSRCQVCCKLHEINELIYNLRKIEDGDFV